MQEQPAGHEDDTAEIVDIAETLKTAIRFGKVADNAKSVEIEESWKEDSYETRGNRNKLIQVFLNLIQNSLQSMPDGGIYSFQ
ncbi:MAG: hypothetical protein R3B45_06490 [Bdellovibrionota bacterium]